MKVLIINGSPRKDGNTSCAVAELEKTIFLTIIASSWICGS